MGAVRRLEWRFCRRNFHRWLAYQSSGNILCAGSDGRVQRYTPTGSLDTTFANKGTLSTGLIVGQSSFAGQMVIQSDDRILYAGVLSGNVVLARYTPSGALDPTFGTNGRITLNPGGSGGTLPDEIAIDGQGRALVAADYPQLAGPNSQLVLARYIT